MTKQLIDINAVDAETDETGIIIQESLNQNDLQVIEADHLDADTDGAGYVRWMSAKFRFAGVVGKLTLILGYKSK